MNLFSLQGKRALVTGASRGLGQAIAVAVAESGADVVCASTAGAEETTEDVKALGRKAWDLRADFADREQLQRLVADVPGEINILINNAGTIRRHTAVEYPTSDWDLVLEVNLNAVFLLCRHFGSRMVARGSGKIINIASLLSFTGGITVPAYTASKHAVAGLTRALANEWAASGVQVNAIAPGYFRTDNTQALQDNSERAKSITDRIPAGRWGLPEDLAGAAVFLASPASDYVNGHVLVVDGGWTAR